MITITTENLVITLRTWKEILEKNGVSWHVAETDGFMLVNLKDAVSTKNNFYKFSKDEIINLIKGENKSNALTIKYSEQIIKNYSLKMAIAEYTKKNKLIL